MNELSVRLEMIKRHNENQAFNNEDKKAELERTREEIKGIGLTTINLIPSIPADDYRLIGVVSAQSIKSTGFALGGAADGIGAMLDFSNTKSTNAGLNELLNDLRVKCHELGGNAVIGVDIDIADTGGLKTVLMCANGTAVRIKNLDLYFGKKAWELQKNGEKKQNNSGEDEGENIDILRQGKLQALDYTEFSDAKVVLTHPSGLAKIFNDMSEAKKYVGAK